MRRRPTVLFVDYFTWEGFTALAGAAQRHGLRVSRLSSRPRDRLRWAMQIADRLVYGRTWDAVIPPPAKGSDAILTTNELPDDDLVDIQAPDDLSLTLLATVPAAPAIMRRTSGAVDQAILFDKAAMQDLARHCGVAVPREYESEPDLPVVVKSSVGSGGDRVRVARNPEELAEAVADLHSLSDSPVVLQQYLGGGQLSVGAVAKEGRLLVSAAYETQPAPHDPNGPPSIVTAVDRPRAVDATAAMAAAVGANGFICADFVLDDEGREYFIDYNPRIFGSWPALQELGADFIGAYLHVLGLGPDPGPTTPTTGEPRFLLRFPAEPPDREALVAWVAASLEVVRRRWRFLGIRWALLSLIKIAAGAVQARADLASEPD